MYYFSLQTSIIFLIWFQDLHGKMYLDVNNLFTLVGQIDSLANVGIVSPTMVEARPPKDALQQNSTTTNWIEKFLIIGAVKTRIFMSINVGTLLFAKTVQLTLS